MKKLFSILAATLFATTMFAATAVMQYTQTTTTNMAGEGANNAELVELNPAVFTVIADKGGTNNFPGLNKDKDIRLYANKTDGNGNIITVSITGGTINSIVLDIKQRTNHEVKVGSNILFSEVQDTYTINSTSFSIQNVTKGVTTQLHLNKITIDYTLEGVTVEAPTFEPKEGNFEGDVTVTLACATEGASIFYTTDGTEPATTAGASTYEYSGPFTISETATIKAIAVTGAGKSAVAEKTYTKLVVKQYEVKEAIDAELNKGDLIKVRGVVTNMAAKGTNFATYGSLKIYVKDATGAEGEFQLFNCYSLNEAKFETTVPAYDATSANWADFTSVTDADGHTLKVGDTIVAKGKYELYNGTYELQQGCYLVDVKEGTSPTPGVIEITNSDDTHYNDYVYDEGYWIFEVETSTYYLTLSNLDLTITQAAGTYTAAELDPDYTYLLTETDSIWFVDGSITLAVSGETTTIKGDLVGKDGNTYRLNLSCAPDSYKYDEDANFTAAFDSYDVDAQYVATYGELDVKAQDDNGQYISLAFMVPTTATGLTAGSYAISTSGSEGTVSAGYFEGGYVYPSFAATLTATGGLDKIWYLVSGTVTVDANLNITIAAKNSLNRDITVTLSSGSTTGINNAKAAERFIKVIENGQLIINVNGVRYNVNGARVK